MNIFQKTLIRLVQVYQKILSPDHSFWAHTLDHPPYCKHIPSCSDYMIQSIEKKGALIGGSLGLYRILRCNPWSRGGYDPVLSPSLPMPDSLLCDIPVGHYSGYRTPVVARYFFEVRCREDIVKLTEIFHFADNNHIPLLIISGGTNILFASRRYEGIIIKNSLQGWSYDEQKKILTAYSDVRIWEIAESLENNFVNSLWHRFIGLPGAIGGAVVGNAGCFGLETESNFVSAEVYDMRTGTQKTLSKEEMQFSYRHSFLKEYPELFLISAMFDLSRKEEKYHSDVDNIEFRNTKQPKGNSCGSFFKNPSREVSAGMLIEQVGLKGYRYGGASWSDIHANFLLSDGDTCSGEDLIALVRLTQERVLTETGHHLINEVRIVGE